MKSIKKFSVKLLAFFVIVFSSACSKSDSDDTAPSNSNPSTTSLMTAMVNSVSWASLNARAAGTIISGVSNVSGVASDSSFITITINQVVAAGDTIDLGFGQSNAGAYSLNTNGSIPAWTSNSNTGCYGVLIVTSLNMTTKLMSGTFSFKAWRGTDNTFKEITAGVFTNMPFATSVSTGGSDFLTVKINGSTFNASIVSGFVNSGVLHLVGSDSQGSKSVGINIPANITNGSNYTFGTAFSTYYGQYNPDGSTFTTSTAGDLFITSHNLTTKKIEGMFGFTSVPYPLGGTSILLTEGEFSITYN